MSWYILDELGNKLLNITSFKLEQVKDKPATLMWTQPLEQSLPMTNISLWRKDECIFKGSVYNKPTHFKEDLVYWTAVAIDDSFQQQRVSLIADLNQTAQLTSTIKDCEGAQPGYIHIDRNTHKVSWVSLNQPKAMWDVQQLHERDSIHITPIDTPLKGVSASVKFSEKRLESGMMDVGAFISGQLSQGIETYSGASLEDQWKNLEFKALRAGYDIQYSELIPTSYQRADLDKALTFLDHKDQLVSICYQSYNVKLLLSWAVPVTTYTTVTVTTPESHEFIALNIKDSQSMHEPDIVNEMVQWMNAYAVNRSFTTVVKIKVLITDDIPLSNLDTRCWARLIDHRIQPEAIEGFIVSYTLTNTEGVTWADISLMWAPEPPLFIGQQIVLASAGKRSEHIPKTPDQIIAWVNVLNDANQQFEYYIANPSKPFEVFAADFPMTQLEIGLHPVLNDPNEYLEKKYTTV